MCENNITVIFFSFKYYVEFFLAHLLEKLITVASIYVLVDYGVN